MTQLTRGSTEAWDASWTFHGLSKELVEDMQAQQRWFDCSLFLLSFPHHPITDSHLRTGWRWVKHEDHRHKLAVGWRRLERIAKADAKREAEKAACPYVECTCGHHED